ncbi:helix-turn-helix domain-containing protein [Sorangium sp. So ce134]
MTQLRIGRARALLTRGVPPSEIAARVGLYDQSQLNRHFKRIVGITPGQCARRGVSAPRSARLAPDRSGARARRSSIRARRRGPAAAMGFARRPSCSTQWWG